MKTLEGYSMSAEKDGKILQEVQDVVEKRVNSHASHNQKAHGKRSGGGKTGGRRTTKRSAGGTKLAREKHAGKGPTRRAQRQGKAGKQKTSLSLKRPCQP